MATYEKNKNYQKKIDFRGTPQKMRAYDRQHPQPSSLGISDYGMAATQAFSAAAEGRSERRLATISQRARKKCTVFRNVQSQPITVPT
jgi:hypothetical protein